MAADRGESESEESKSKAVALSRRGLLKKYGPYTAPIVVSMLTPEIAYGHNTMSPFSSTATCLADSNHTPTMNRHCGINPGMNAYPIG